MSDGQFEDVGGFEKSWNPRQTGSKKKGNRVPLEPTDKSWIHGYYLGSRDQQIDNKNYVIHKVLAINFGDPTHSDPIADKTKGELREFFGTKVLNDVLAKNIQMGECVRIQWLGKKQPKKAGGDPYDDWKVQRDVSRAPISPNKPVASANTEAHGEGGAPIPNNTPAASNVTDEDDDLPF